jgi:hypothetical protein
VRAGELLRGVPGVANYLEGMEAKDYAVAPSIRIGEVLATDEQLEAWKVALAQAITPPFST